MATKPTKTSSVKAKSAKSEKTTAPKVSRARKSDVVSDVQPVQSGMIPTPAHDEIAMRAYARFAARGFQHGHDVEDWLAAERELTQQ
jgi:hypothetical protein